MRTSGFCCETALSRLRSAARCERRGPPQDPAGLLDLGALGGIQLGQPALHRLGDHSQRGDLSGQVRQHIVRGAGWPGRFPGLRAGLRCALPGPASRPGRAGKTRTSAITKYTMTCGGSFPPFRQHPRGRSSHSNGSQPHCQSASQPAIMQPAGTSTQAVPPAGPGGIHRRDPGQDPRGPGRQPAAPR